LACFYYRLLKYREQNTKDKGNGYSVIHCFVKSPVLGKLTSLFGLVLVLTNLVICWPANSDPGMTSATLNAWYFAISRSSFVLGFACIIWAVFLGHDPMTKATMSGSNMRIISRSIVIGCILEVLVIELLFCSDALPQGLYITFPIALILGVGFKFVTPIVSILIMMFTEFPLIRLYQFCILPWISHDALLEEYFNSKGIESNFDKTIP
tara:strand:- start:202 stop:828 length:627 start_codon:yes stop_codon:yes gene_type:complete